jgi:transcriptional regulator NrdR family protein
MKCSCGGDTYVTSTVKSDAGVFRRRKCPACGSRAQTLESWIEPKYKKLRLQDTLPPLPEEKDIYTTNEADQIKQRKVAARRLNEDRNRALQYLGDDDFDF